MENVLRYLAGPLIGAAIGYCTNYIAVKMLFYPRKEIRIGNFKVPFTPGAIPKGKPRLAKAIGDVVGNTLLTKEDITEQLMSGNVEENVVNQAMKSMTANIRQAACGLLGSETDCRKVREKLKEVVTDAMMESVGKLDMKSIVVEEGGRIIKEKTAGTMLAMFVSDELIQSFTEPASEEIETFIQENGREKIAAELAGKFDQLEETSVIEVLNGFDIGEEKLKGYLSNLYQGLISGGAEGILQQLNVPKLVEDKINAMDVIELEQLVMTVMKKELNTIVNLGALIGLLLGLLNILI